MYKRTLLTLGSAIVITLAGAMPAAAADPNGLGDPSIVNSNDPSVVMSNQTATMTAAQLATYNQKVALANALNSKQGIIPTSDPATRTLITHSGQQLTQIAPMSIPGSLELTVYARQQLHDFYCGPTAIQVMSNLVWGAGYNGSNHFTQDDIAVQAGTIQNGQTLIGGEKTAANWSLINSSEAWFPYLIAQPPDGHTFWSYLSTDVSYYTMPVIANLAPAVKVGSTYYHLADWAYNNLGHKHYIVLNGYNGEWDGTHGPGLWFADGAGGLGGGTGVYYDEQYSTYMEISHLYDYIVW